MTAVVRIGTRGSELALWQANEVRKRLAAAGYRSEITTFKTTGDKRQDVSLASIGGKGVFIKELEEALARREIDVAVHSLKDVPSFIPSQFRLAAFLERADPRDAWVHPEHRPIAEMAEGSTIGTSAPRRRTQLRVRYPRLRIEEMRGNVDTRIKKVHAGVVDGVILAAAGLKRLGRESDITSFFAPEDMTPAAGQGIVAIEAMTDEAAEIAAAVNHAPTAEAARCERAVLQKFEDRLDCYSAVGVHATFDGQTTIRAFFGEIDGDRSVRITRSGSDSDEVVEAAYRALVDAGVMELVVR